jgi:calmodulin
MSDSKNSSDPRHLAGQRELKEEFAVADRDDDGRVNFVEFKRLLAGLDADMSEQELDIGFREVDRDSDGLIDFREFVDWWTAD